MVLVIAALLGLAAAMIVLYPLLGLHRDPQERLAAGLEDVAERERAARGALREVEFDYRLGALEDADYQALRERYEERALAALRSRYSRERALDALIDRELEALRAEAAPAATIGPVDPTRASGAAKSRRPPARRRRGGAHG